MSQRSVALMACKSDVLVFGFSRFRKKALSMLLYYALVSIRLELFNKNSTELSFVSDLLKF